MTETLGISSQALFGQLLIGLINGSFYALLSLGLAVIFGLLNIVNFAHGAMYMMGAFCAWLLLNYFGLGYWPALIIAPLVVGAIGIIIERFILKRIYKLDHLYGLLLTFGLALIIEGVFRQQYGSSGQPYAIREALAGGQNLGFMFLPNYRAWVIGASAVLCIGTWMIIEKRSWERISARQRQNLVFRRRNHGHRSRAGLDRGGCRAGGRDQRRGSWWSTSSVLVASRSTARYSPRKRSRNRKRSANWSAGLRSI